MNRLPLPDVEDLESVVTDYFDSLLPTHLFDQERLPIIQRCIPAFEQLMQLIQHTSANGKAEEILLAAFMRDLGLATVRRPEENSEALTHAGQQALH